jgi:hypothetical protein
VEAKYRAKRYEVVWTCAASLPSIRYPQPYPMHNQSWSFAFDGENRRWIKCHICGIVRPQSILRFSSGADQPFSYMRVLVNC